MIYFIAADGIGLIKIGYAVDPAERLAELRLMSPVGLTPIGAVEGSYLDEKDTHRRFVHLRSHGEWFFGVPELRAYIAALVGVTSAPPFRPTRPRTASPTTASPVLVGGTREFRAWFFGAMATDAEGPAGLADRGMRRLAARRGYPPPPDLPAETRACKPKLRRGGGSLILIKAPPPWRAWAIGFAGSLGLSLAASCRLAIVACGHECGWPDPPDAETIPLCSILV